MTPSGLPVFTDLPAPPPSLRADGGVPGAVKAPASPVMA